MKISFDSVQVWVPSLWLEEGSCDWGSYPSESAGLGQQHRYDATEAQEGGRKPRLQCEERRRSTEVSLIAQRHAA